MLRSWPKTLALCRQFSYDVVQRAATLNGGRILLPGPFAIALAALSDGSRANHSRSRGAPLSCP